jgi:glucan endo-1,3-beta-D-glucosidase
VAGISVGSEDLYRISPTGILNKENPGAQPDVLAGYIKKLRDLISGTSLSGAPIGHVDTWTAWVNGSNQAVVDACDWLGVDAYPYFQETNANAIANNKGLFFDALGATQAASKGKPVWVTETGFPVSGKTVGQAVPSLENAKTYWDQVGCSLFGKTNVWWYTMQDAAPATPNPSFGLVGSSLTTTPLFDLSCANVDTSYVPQPFP